MLATRRIPNAPLITFQLPSSPGSSSSSVHDAFLLRLSDWKSQSSEDHQRKLNSTSYYFQDCLETVTTQFSRCSSKKSELFFRTSVTGQYPIHLYIFSRDQNMYRSQGNGLQITNGGTTSLCKENLAFEI
jgi:hypothetical protein